MKISWKIISFVIIIYSAFSENFLQTENQDLLTIPKVLHDIAEKFLLNKNTELNIFVFKSDLQVLHDIATNFMLTTNETFLYRLKNYKSLHSNIVPYLRRPAFLFLDDIFTFEYLHTIFELLHLQSQPIKHFAFIPNLTFDQLKSSQIYDRFESLPIVGGGVFVHTYFITNEVNTVTLSTVEWFSPYRCHRPYLLKLNTFDKKTKKWNSNLENYEKFLNYYNCELVMALPIPLFDSFIYHISGYSIINKDGTDFDVHGISPVIFEIGAEHHNYRPAYQPVFMGKDFLYNLDDEKAKIIPINRTFKQPNLYFEISSSIKLDQRLQMSKTLSNLNVYVFLTPGEKYTPYEKFILPFDMHTWILLFVTFLITFLSIVIINRLSKSAQIIVYGDNVATPIWNVLRIFFGISQTKLPNKKFSRFILMIFIFFCLIFRTCFQSKFFEFMTSDPRHPAPRTIDELKERNYNLYTLEAIREILLLEDEPSEWYVVSVVHWIGCLFILNYFFLFY